MSDLKLTSISILIVSQSTLRNRKPSDAPIDDEARLLEMTEYCFEEGCGRLADWRFEIDGNWFFHALPIQSR